MPDPARLATAGRFPGAPTDDLASRLWRQWQEGRDPDARQLLGDSGSLPAALVVEVLRVDQCQRWQRGKPVPAEEYLRWFPQLASEPERALELIYGEYLLREQLEQAPKPAEFIRRFPQFADRLDRQLQLHSALEAASATMSWSPPRTVEPGPPNFSTASNLPEVAGYEVLRELGRGGMGVVYLARNTLMDRLEALKVVNKERVGRQEAVERFLQEIRAAARLNHPNVATAYSAHQHGDLVVLAMEFVEGEDLSKVVRGRGALPISNACFCVHQAASGLQRAHELGLVHRDIKPGNLLLGKQGKRHLVKIVDFGLAKARTEVPEAGGLTVSNQMLGTPGYTAPEQLRDAKSADIRADVYSLGCTLYYLLAGVSPFKGGSAYQVLHAQQTDDLRMIRHVRADVPQELADVVARMMAKAPGNRFQQPGEVAAALVPFIKQAAKVPVSTGGTPPPGAPAASTDTHAGVDTCPGQPPTSAGSESAAPLSAASLVKPRQTGKALRRAAEDGGSIDAETVVRPSSDGFARRYWTIILAFTVLLAALVGVVAGFARKSGAPTSTVSRTNGPSESPTAIAPATGNLSYSPAANPPVTPLVAPAKPPSTFVPIFNGRDVAGWKPLPGDKAEWTVKDGVLTGKGGTGHLFWFGNVYENFHLRAEAMVTRGGNSGIIFRAPFGPTTSGGFPAGAYEAQINNTHGVRHKTGSLSFNNKVEVGLTESSVKDDRWFTLEVIADGPHVTLKVNGQVTASYVDAGPVPASGRVALQVHGAETVVKFREVSVKELSRGQRRLQWVHSKGAFEQVKGDVWMERFGDLRFFYRETERTPEYVRLQRKERGGNDRDFFAEIRRTSTALSRGGTHWNVAFKDGSWKVLGRTQPAATPHPERAGEWVQMFNGKDLAGWRSGGNDKAKWTVEGGEVVGESAGGSSAVLVTNRDDYSDFDLRMEVQTGESGGQVCLRCNPPEEGPGAYRCYAVKLVAGPDAAGRTGSLALAACNATGLDLAAASGAPSKPGGWLALEVIAQGNHVQVLVDGKSAAGYTDLNDTFLSGRIGLACPRTGSIRFRKVEVRELPATKPDETAR